MHYHHYHHHFGFNLVSKSTRFKFLPSLSHAFLAPLDKMQNSNPVICAAPQQFVAPLHAEVKVHLC